MVHAITRSSRLPTDFACHVRWLNMRDMNSEQPWFRNGDLVVHLPGRSNAGRQEFFQKLQEMTDFSTGTIDYERRLEMWVEPLDWKVGRGLFADTRGAGWNIPCRNLYSGREQQS